MSTELYEGVDQQELTGYARDAIEQDQSTQALAAWMPNLELDDVEWRITGADNPVLTVAQFRTWDAESPIAGRQWASDEIRGRMAPISQKRRVHEYDQLRLRQLDQDIEDQVFRDSRQLGLEVSARMNLARGEILSQGSLTLDENGVEQTVDFGRNVNRRTAIGTAWDDTANSDPLGDMLAAQAQFRTWNNRDVGAFVISETAWEWMLQSDTLKAQVIASTDQALTRATPAQIDNARTAYGLAPIVINEEKYQTDTGEQRVLENNSLYVLPDPSVRIGNTFYGTTLESQRAGLVGREAPGIVVLAEETFDPIQLWTKAAAITMPVLATPDFTYVLTDLFT